MIYIECVKCKTQLIESGALVFSFPSEANIVRKMHLCRRCYNLLLMWIERTRHQQKTPP